MSRIDTFDMPGFLRIVAQKRAISSEFAPRSSKKWCSVETRSTRSTSHSAACRMRSFSVFGAHVAGGRRGEARELRLRQPLVVGLVGERHRDRRQLFEEGRHHVGRQLGCAAPAKSRSRGSSAPCLNA